MIGIYPSRVFVVEEGMWAFDDDADRLMCVIFRAHEISK